RDGHLVADAGHVDDDRGGVDLLHDDAVEPSDQLSCAPCSIQARKRFRSASGSGFVGPWGMRRPHPPGHDVEAHWSSAPSSLFMRKLFSQSPGAITFFEVSAHESTPTLAAKMVGMSLGALPAPPR